MKTLIKNKDKYLNELPEEDDQGRIHMVANLLFCYASNFPKVDILEINKSIEKQYELYLNYEYELMDSIQFCDNDHLARLVQAVYLFFFDKCWEVINRLEHKTRDEKDTLDSYHLTKIIRGFTRFKTRNGVGRNKTFVQLEQPIHDNFDNFDIRSLSEVMYAYGFREQGNPELHEKFLKRILDQDELMDHQTVSNLLYYAMFTDNTDEAIWTKIIQNNLQNDAFIPVTHYTPFKMSKFYLRHHFPDLDISDYYSKFFYPERYFNTNIRDNKVAMDQSKVDFIQYLVGNFFLYSVDYVPFHNLFLLHHCFMDQKIAINFFANHEMLPQEHRISARQKLDGKIMGYEGWEVLNVTQKEHESMIREERNEFYRAWITTAKERQYEKGIMSRDPPLYKLIEQSQ